MAKKTIEELFSDYAGECSKEDEFGAPVGRERFWEADSVDRKTIRVCRVKCNRCGCVIEYEHKSKTETPHVLLTCTCKSITVDPAPMSTRILCKSEDDFTELHEYWGKLQIPKNSENT